MSVTTELSQIKYAGRGDTGPYVITFHVTYNDIGNAEYIKVYVLDKTTGVKTDITSTSSIDGLNVTTAIVYDSNYEILILRDPPFTQENDFTYGSSFPAALFNKALDKLTMLAIRLKESLFSSIQKDLIDDKYEDDGVTPVRMTLPLRQQRKNMALIFDEQGSVTTGTFPTPPASPFMANVIKADNLEDAHDRLFTVKRIIEYAHYVGEYFYRGGPVMSPTAFDPSNPRAYNPNLCLDTISTYIDISETNWPLLVPELRSWKLHYLEGLTGETDAYTLSNWGISSNVATLTFANNSANNAVLAIISEFYLTTGYYQATGYYQVVNIASDIGNIPAGDYLITSVDTVALTVTFACTASDGSGATTNTVSFFPHRIVGSTTTARVYGAKAMALMSAGTGTHMGSQMRRSYMQGHWHEVVDNAGNVMEISSDFPIASGEGNRRLNLVPGAAAAKTPKPDGTNGTPRTGSETEPRSITAHLYLGGGSYIEP